MNQPQPQPSESFRHEHRPQDRVRLTGVVRGMLSVLSYGWEKELEQEARTLMQQNPKKGKKK